MREKESEYEGIERKKFGNKYFEVVAISIVTDSKESEKRGRV